MTPALDKGLHRLELTLKGIDLTCDFEIEEGERGSRENGLQMEPDIKPNAVLCFAWLGEVDISELIGEDNIMHLEQEALDKIRSME